MLPVHHHGAIQGHRLHLTLVIIHISALGKEYLNLRHKVYVHRTSIKDVRTYRLKQNVLTQKNPYPKPILLYTLKQTLTSICQMRRV
jgi:hypothetical protein